MSLPYTLWDPTGNRTILVSAPVEVSRQPAVAAALMRAEPTAEQVGFLSADGLSLRMAGGEFCGNASISAAAAYCRAHGLERADVPLTVSGADGTVTVTVSAFENGWRGSVEMPEPAAIREESLTLLRRTVLLPVVHFPGISHVIVSSPMTPALAEEAAPLWCRALHADALGILLLNEAEHRMVPLVYVPAADTLVWEHSCASGTAAVGAYLAARDGKKIRVSLQEPGGMLTVQAVPGEKPRLTGTVRLEKAAE